MRPAGLLGGDGDAVVTVVVVVAPGGEGGGVAVIGVVVVTSGAGVGGDGDGLPSLSSSLVCRHALLLKQCLPPKLPVVLAATGQLQQAL